MKRIAGMAVWFGALVLASTAFAADADAGKEIYTKKCAGCHGADGKGNAKMAGMLKTTFPDLTNGSTKTEADLVKLISDGQKPMPAFKKSLSADDVKSVILYVQRFGGAQTVKQK